MININVLAENDYAAVHELAGEIDGIVQHPAHVYKIMNDHFGDTFFIAKEDDEKGNEHLQGFMMGFISHKVARHLFVWQIAVSPQAQGKSIGSKLLEYTIGYARKSNDCEAVLATVETDNVASQKLFEKFGFQIESERFKGQMQDMSMDSDREAVANYYGSGTDQIFYVLRV